MSYGSLKAKLRLRREISVHTLFNSLILKGNIVKINNIFLGILIAELSGRLNMRIDCEYIVLLRFVDIDWKANIQIIDQEIKMIRPLHDRIIVKRASTETKTRSGIIIPDTAKEKPQEGKVIAVGKGKTADDGSLIPMSVKKGDNILFGKYAGSEIKIESEEYIMMKEDDVLGIIK